MRRAIPFLIVMLVTVGGVPAEDAGEDVREDVPRDGGEVGGEDTSGDAGEDMPGDGAAEAKKEPGPGRQGPKMVSGMSILGNQEAPKSLVIVPWKSSQIGDSLSVSTVLDDSRQPIDREVFLRELSYYQIRSGGKP